MTTDKQVNLTGAKRSETCQNASDVPKDTPDASEGSQGLQTRNRVCEICASPAQLLMVGQWSLIPKCINCFLAAAMNHVCALCGTERTDLIVRAETTEKKPGTIGVCLGCFYKHMAITRSKTVN